MSELLCGVKILPQLTPTGIYVGHVPVLPVDRERIDRVLYNVMRGVFYVVHKEPMPLDWQWGIGREHEIPTEEIEKLSDQMGPAWHTFGDDVFACRYVFAHEARCSVSCDSTVAAPSLAEPIPKRTYVLPMKRFRNRF